MIVNDFCLPKISLGKQKSFKQKTAYEISVRDGVQTCALPIRSEEHTSELQSRTLISYAVFCLDRKSTRLNSSHERLSLMPSSALKKKNITMRSPLVILKETLISR